MHSICSLTRKCDLASMESVREFVTQFRSQEESCDVLVNNAGVMNCRRMLTKVIVSM